MKKTCILLLLVCLPFLLGPVVAAAPDVESGSVESVAGHEAAGDDALASFAAELETIRQELNVPGWSAAIVQDQELVWAEGFGYADLERQVPATADTPYAYNITAEDGDLDLPDSTETLGSNIILYVFT